MKKNESTDLKKMSQPSIKVDDPTMPSRPDQNVQVATDLSHKAKKNLPQAENTFLKRKVKNAVLGSQEVKDVGGIDKVHPDEQLKMKIGAENVANSVAATKGRQGKIGGAFIKHPEGQHTAISTNDPKNQVHEGNHLLTQRLVEKHGVDKISAMYDSMLNNVHPEVHSKIDSLINRNYGHFKDHENPRHALSYKEEKINMLRDILSPGSRRDSWYGSHGAKRDHVEHHTNKWRESNKEYDLPDNIKNFMRQDGHAKSSWKNVVNHAKNYLNKTENFEETDLTKGSFQRRNRYNPENDVPSNSPIADNAAEWINSEDQNARDKYHKLEDGGRARALKRLASSTKMKMKDGVKHFLMHRGMSHEEHESNIQDGKHYHPKPDTRTSWTPNYTQAGKHDDGKIASAWIPEHDIQHIPMQHGEPVTSGETKKPQEYRHEHEVIVNHSQPHRLANRKHILNLREQRQDNYPGLKPAGNSINEKINARGNPKIQQNWTPSKMRDVNKSELLIFNDLIKNIDIYGDLSKDEINLLVDNVLEKNSAMKVLRGLGLGVALTAGAQYMGQQPQQAEKVAPKIDQDKQYFLNRIKKLGYRANENDIHSHISSKTTPFAKDSILDAKTLYNGMPSSPAIKDAFQDSHYDYLKDKFHGSQDHMAHAWKNGIDNTYKVMDSKQKVEDLDSTLRFNSVPNVDWEK